MPKFSDQEKTMIMQKLRIEGERLFSLYGIKKVSIDEIVKATGIAKGSFYAFYPNKEHLYFEILGYLQAQMWKDMEALLQQNHTSSPRNLCKKCFLFMFESIEHYPMLKVVDSETVEYLYRKLPPEIIAAHTKDDLSELIKLQEYGIEFSCGIEVATKILQTLAISFVNLQQENDTNKKLIIDIILDGVLKEIISDENH